MTTRELHLTVPPGDVNAVHDLMATVWTEEPNIATLDQYGFELALIELVSNVILHSGVGLSITVSIESLPDRLGATVLDTGCVVTLPTDEPSLRESMEESGRGLGLMHALVSDIRYERVGDHNRWHFVRWRYIE